MTDVLYAYELTVPAGTIAAAPAILDMPIPSGAVDRVLVRVPPGPHAAVGYQIWYGGGQFVPEAIGGWLVVDDAVVELDPPADMSAGSWQLQAYNSGTYDHTLRVELYVAAASSAAVAPLTLVTPLAIG